MGRIGGEHPAARNNTVQAERAQVESILLDSVPSSWWGSGLCPQPLGWAALASHIFQIFSFLFLVLKAILRWTHY